MGLKIIFLLLLVIFVVSYSGVSALQENYCVESSITDIRPSSIGVGKEFTIGVQIENCGSKIPEFVSFELLNPPKDIIIKEPLVINISNLYYGNSERFITYHMRTNDDASPGTYVIKTRLSYGDSQFSIIKNNNITFEVIGEKAEISIASIKTSPILPYEKDTVELTLRVENVGKGAAKSIRVDAEHPFQGIKQTFVGKLAPEEDGPAIFTFIADKYGEFEFPVTISYYDDFGENKVSSNINLTILKKKTNVRRIILTILILGVIGWMIFYFFKIKKSKDKIIHQLLKGNNQNEKEKK